MVPALLHVEVGEQDIAVPLSCVALFYLLSRHGGHGVFFEMHYNEAARLIRIRERGILKKSNPLCSPRPGGKFGFGED